MGSKATTDKVAADMSPPNYRAAVQRLRRIKVKKDKISSVNGEIADVYAKVEGHKVNRKGAKIWMILDSVDAAERNDMIRTIDGLSDAAGWDEEAKDMVDLAEGTVVHMRFGKDGVGPAPGNEGGSGDDEIDTLADEIAAGTAADSANAFIEKARSHLNGGDGSQAPETDDDGGEDGDHRDA